MSDILNKVIFEIHNIFKFAFKFIYINILKINIYL